MNNIHIICNPVSGQGAPVEALNKIKDWAKFQKNLDLKIHMTENEGHATVIARDITSNNDSNTILVIGGDGTLNEVLNGIVNFNNTYLGILPFGSGNDFAASLGFDKEIDPVALVNDYINRPSIRKVDYLLLNDKYRVLNCIGLGCSAEVIALRNRMKHFSPKTQYKLATIAKSLFWKGFNYTYTVDGQQPVSIKSMWFTINNGKRIGGGVITAPEAKIDDGQITCSYIKAFKHILTIEKLAKVKKGKITSIKENKIFNCKHLVMDLPNVTVEFDGNLLHDQTKIDVQIVEKQLNILQEVKQGE